MFYMTDNFLHRKTTAISKSPYYTWVNVKDIMKVNSWSYMVVGWDWMEKSVHSVINEAMRAQKMLWWKILLRWIFENLYGCTPLHWGHPHLTSHKFENSPFKRYEWRYNPIQKRNSPDLNRLPNTRSWNSRIVPNSIPQPYCPDVRRIFRNLM